MITDRSFTDDYQLDYRFHLLGTIGDHILVDGVPTPHFKVADRKYRFRILSRRGGIELPFGTPGDPDVEQGETGLRETFLVVPGEIVEIVSRFTDHTGRYVFHCHILEHEDNAMMAQFEVVR